MIDEEELCSTQPTFYLEENVNVDTLRNYKVSEVTRVDDYWSEIAEGLDVFQIELEIVIAQDEDEENEMKIEVISERREELQKESKEEQLLVLVKPLTLSCMLIKPYKGMEVKECSQIFYTTDTFVLDEHNLISRGSSNSRSDTNCDRHPTIPLAHHRAIEPSNLSSIHCKQPTNPRLVFKLLNQEILRVTDQGRIRSTISFEPSTDFDVNKQCEMVLICLPSNLAYPTLLELTSSKATNLSLNRMDEMEGMRLEELIIRSRQENASENIYGAMYIIYKI
ncbi:hypothetical protein Syun_001924 [Stephania yunnanensis]|uniref:Uncharacterized protein n=1 Tax=Stephania yunnanensis TaxID=152371 RepID=A0AAP0LIT7_9MAGN